MGAVSAERRQDCRRGKHECISAPKRMDSDENGSGGVAVKVGQTLETVKPYECMIWDRGRMGKWDVPEDFAGRTRKGD